ncbi:unnamed protein product, partial [Rotaria sp. Silwood2]
MNADSYTGDSNHDRGGFRPGCRWKTEGSNDFISNMANKRREQAA